MATKAVSVWSQSIDYDHDYQMAKRGQPWGLLVVTGLKQIYAAVFDAFSRVLCLIVIISFERLKAVEMRNTTGFANVMRSTT